MSQILKNGDSIVLKEEANRLSISLGWSCLNKSNVDASIICINPNKAFEKMIYRRHIEAFCGAIYYHENVSVNDTIQFDVDLTKIPSDIDSMFISINVLNRQSGFGDLLNCFARIDDVGTKKEIIRYNIPGNFRGDTDIIVGNIYHSNDTWIFKTFGNGVEFPNIYELIRYVLRNNM